MKFITLHSYMVGDQALIAHSIGYFLISSVDFPEKFNAHIKNKEKE